MKIKSFFLMSQLFIFGICLTSCQHDNLPNYDAKRIRYMDVDGDGIKELKITFYFRKKALV